MTVPAESIAESISVTAARLTQVREAVRECVVGQEHVVDHALIAFLARGHVLLEGVPGTAKTLLIRTLGSALGVRFGRIQFTPDLMPSDITGVSVLRDASRGFEFRPGPLFTDFLLADEINRAPAKTQSALLEAMAERQATVDGTQHPLGPLFSVFATQNPVEHEGTYPLPAAQLDRFLLKVILTYPTEGEELTMLERHVAGFDAERFAEMAPRAVLDAESCRELRGAVDHISVAPEVQAYIAAIVRATRDDTALTLGASPRASVALLRASRASAVVAGRDFVTPDDVKDLALPALRHRVTVSPELEVEGRTADDVLSALLERVNAPR
jgi:MoxR-like ATPase